jgi:hypothetical protein
LGDLPYCHIFGSFGGKQEFLKLSYEPVVAILASFEDSDL